MNRRTIGNTVAAMILAAQLGSPLAAAEPSLEQLTVISSHLASNEVAALRDYLDTNPELLEGETPLAVLLRRFMRELGDLPAYLAFAPDLRDAVQVLVPDPDGDTIY